MACPGYPFEKCGDRSAGLYGYVALGPAPSGTQGSASTPSAVNPSPTQATQPVVQPVSTQSLPEVFGGTSLPPVPKFPASSFLGPPYITSSTPISLETHVLNPSAQDPSTDPSPVTVQDTVTIQPSVEVSYVSIVCF